MKTLTEIGISKLSQSLVNSLSHATYELDAIEQTIPMLSTNINDGIIRIYVYFDSSIAGVLQNIKLIDTEGDVIALNDRVFVKPLTLGLTVVFKYNMVEMEAAVEESEYSYFPPYFT